MGIVYSIWGVFAVIGLLAHVGWVMDLRIRLRSAERREARLRAENVRQQGVIADLEGKLDAWEGFREEVCGLQYHSQGMGCGIEDRGITDRYEACAYGWDEALERVGERMPEA